MSGLEIVGVVIGTIPLCDLARKSFKGTRNKVSRFKHYEAEIRQLEKEIDEVRKGLKTSFNTIYALAGLPFSEWHKPCADELEAILQGWSHIHAALAPRYCSSLSRIEKKTVAVKDLLVKLRQVSELPPAADVSAFLPADESQILRLTGIQSPNIREPGAHALDDGRRFKRFKRRVRFALKGDTINEKLRAITAARVALCEQIISLLHQHLSHKPGPVSAWTPDASGFPTEQSSSNHTA